MESLVRNKIVHIRVHVAISILFVLLGFKM